MHAAGMSAHAPLQESADGQDTTHHRVLPEEKTRVRLLLRKVQPQWNDTIKPYTHQAKRPTYCYTASSPRNRHRHAVEKATSGIRTPRLANKLPAMTRGKSISLEPVRKALKKRI